ncbi:hypothetical protein [Nonomuraea sp. NPDC046570]|uniref:hypothetical protein n=1 Tax=Nonomuraea sp. NPDC046570 TaxID=3155255 RepID=UPI0033D8B4B0
MILKAVLATTRTRSPAGGGTTRYEGTITLGQLAEVTPWLRSALRGVFDREDKKSKILWRLWIGKDQLVRRGWTSYTQPGPRGTDVNVHKVIDMRLTGWGGKVKIKTPPTAQVVPGRTG